ncbi:MAG: cupin domain-containing protein [bacterium]|nr:cupin domain-containing protein [bacterium]
MKGFVADIENLAIKNQSFRKVLYTANDTQLVLMMLNPLEEIGEEVHNLDQFFRVEEGTGEVILDGKRTQIHPGFAVPGSGGGDAQPHQHRDASAETLHALLAAEPPRWRRPRHAGGGRGR